MYYISVPLRLEINVYIYMYAELCLHKRRKKSMCAAKNFNLDTKFKSKILFCAQNNDVNAMNNYFMAKAIFKFTFKSC